MSRVMSKPDFRLSNCTADQRLCLCYSDSPIPLLIKSETFVCDCAGRFASDLDGNPEVRFSHVAAQMHKVDQLVRICFTTAEKL